MTASNYKLKFSYLYEHNYCVVETSIEHKILAEYLMYWGDSPKDIVSTLIPQINFGLKYGTQDRYCIKQDVDGLWKLNAQKNVMKLKL